MNDHTNERRCAGCERVVSKYRGRWVDRDPRPGRKYQNAYHFTCDVITVQNGTRLESADYHYVEGETQQHWRAPE